MRATFILAMFAASLANAGWGDPENVVAAASKTPILRDTCKTIPETAGIDFLGLHAALFFVLISTTLEFVHPLMSDSFQHQKNRRDNETRQATPRQQGT